MDLLKIAARVAAGTAKHAWKYVGQEVLQTRPDDPSYSGPPVAGVWHVWKCGQCGEEGYSDRADSVPDWEACTKSLSN